MLSSPRLVYTAGYSGHDPADLRTIAESLDAVVFDIRFSPRSRRPAWSRKRLTELLNGRYRHVPQFGNVRYREGGPALISDFEGGLRVFDGTPGPLILLCQCRDAKRCHRSDVAAYLSEHRNVAVREIDWRDIDRAVEIDQPVEIDVRREISQARLELGEPA